MNMEKMEGENGEDFSNQKLQGKMEEVPPAQDGYDYKEDLKIKT